MERTWADIQPFLEIPVQKYITKIRLSRTWAGNLELSLIQRLFQREIIIMDADLVGNSRRVDIGSQASTLSNKNPIVLSYHGQRHYNAIVNENSTVALARSIDVEGAHGIIIFSNASSVTNVMKLRPLYILQRSVNLWDTPDQSPIVGSLYTYLSSSDRDQTTTSESESSSATESLNAPTTPTTSTTPITSTAPISSSSTSSSSPLVPPVVSLPRNKSADVSKLIIEDSSSSRHRSTLQRRHKDTTSPRSTPLKLSFRKAKSRYSKNAANSSVSNNSNTFDSTDVSNSNRWRRTATFAMMVVLLQASFIIWQMLYNSNDVDKLAQRINMLQEAVAAQQEGVCNTVQKDL